MLRKVLTNAGKRALDRERLDLGGHGRRRDVTVQPNEVRDEAGNVRRRHGLGSGRQASANDVTG